MNIFEHYAFWKSIFRTSAVLACAFVLLHPLSAQSKRSAYIVPSKASKRVNVFPKNTPVQNLSGGVKVIGARDGSKIIVAPKSPMVISSTADSEKDKDSENLFLTEKQGLYKFTATTRFVFIPMNSYGKAAGFQLIEPVSGKVIVGAKGVLAPAGVAPDWYMEVDISDYKNSELHFVYERNSGRAAPLQFSNIVPERKWRNDFSRPEFHFSPRVGKLEDVGALTYFKNNWFALYMFDPFTITGENPPATGVAVSDNLMRWAYLPPVKTRFDSSGKMDSATPVSFVDSKNRSGLFNGQNGGVVFVRNVKGVGDCLSYTSDMRNFYAASINPVIKKAGKNPSLFYDETLKKWVLLRIEFKPKGSIFAQTPKDFENSVKKSAPKPKKPKIDIQGGDSNAPKKTDSRQSTNKKSKRTAADIYAEVVFDTLAEDVANASKSSRSQPEVEVVDSGIGDTEVAIYTGDTLRALERTGVVDVNFPFAQLVKMPVIGAPNEPRWVLLSGDGRYFVGNFDGKNFVRDTQIPQKLFHGNFEKLTIWQNAPEGRVIVSGRFENPPFMPQYASEVVKYSGAFTAPYEITLVQIHNGLFQLRANLPPEFRYCMILPTDAVGWGGSISFSNNSFMLPDACGNKRAFEGYFNISASKHHSLDIGKYGIGFSKDENKFKITEGDYEIFDFRSQTNTDKSFFNFTMLLDTAGIEFINKAGRDVVIVGDNFFKPDYEIRLLSVGPIELSQMVYFRVAPVSMKIYSPVSLGVYEKIVLGAK